MDTVGQVAVFPACRAVVHHGGSGTTAAGLRAGIPTLILFAFWLDQPIWAVAVEQLKVGSWAALFGYHPGITGRGPAFDSSAPQLRTPEPARSPLR